ncbi:MAG: UvrD-helicase domain-containing protein [Gammaproteobacteria bacterium]|nr:UvrD-helicase domain-containing protein [Gammaproteobacteria bacterium]
MEFRIADTFTESLGKLTGQEQKAVKTAAFDLQMNPANPGLRLHKLEKVKDPNFWSASANMDLRIILHKTAQSLLLCYVNHHDKAYAWAARRKLEAHPTTGAAQLVELRETLKEITVSVYKQETTYPATLPKPYASIAEAELLAYGVPQDWIAEVKQADVDSILNIAERLPAEAAEALLEIAVGGTPQIAQRLPAGASPFDHPDAMRRFRVMSDVDELKLALEYPWDKWTLFLHPAQHDLVEKNFNGPARVSGSAGTGKTIVALHRAACLARNNPDARVLLTTFSDILANALRDKLKRLISEELRLGERLEVYSLKEIGLRQYTANFGRPDLVDEETVKGFIQQAAARHHSTYSPRFLFNEWSHVVDAWQLNAWEGYRDVKRMGRKTRLSEEKRQHLWQVYSEVKTALKSAGLITEAEMFTRLAEKFASNCRPVFDYAIVDEAQDISISQLRFIAALGNNRPNSLFFSGDLGQRIFQQPFSWKSLGVDIRGRSSTLRINYRTSHQIRRQADRLLNNEIIDGDGNTEDRNGTVSLFNGPAPIIRLADSEDAERNLVAEQLRKYIALGIEPHEIGVFVRSDDELQRASNAIQKADLPINIMNKRMESVVGKLVLSTMHLAKGLEFKAVVVMACDDDIIPLESRLSSVSDDTVDLEEVYNTERHLLYVACTRARDYLLVTGVEPGSEFLDDLTH